MKLVTNSLGYMSIDLEKKLLNRIKEQYPEHFEFIINHALTTNPLELLCFIYKLNEYKNLNFVPLTKVDEQINELAGNLFSLLH
jgi:hypothetical protein